MNNPFIVTDELRDATITEYVPVVESIAKRFVQKFNCPQLYDDIVSSGYQGMIYAVSNFDADKFPDLKYYVYLRAHGSMVDFLRNNYPGNAKSVALKKRVTVAVMNLRKELQREPSHEEIATKLEMSMEEFNATMSLIQGTFVTDFTSLTGEGETANQRPGVELAMLNNSTQTSPETKILYDQILKLAKKHCTTREYHIFKAINISEKTAVEVSRDLNISDRRVCQINSATLEKLGSLVNAKI